MPPIQITINPSLLRRLSFDSGAIPNPTHLRVRDLVTILSSLESDLDESLIPQKDTVVISDEADRRFQARSIDGHNNNPLFPMRGGAGQQLARAAAPRYSDGVDDMGGQTRPNPRTISNVVSAQSASIPNDRGLTSMVWQWGQFIDHDIDLTPEQVPNEVRDIPMPRGDAFFDPRGKGDAKIGFIRSRYDTTTGTNQMNPRQQINAITAWLDGSMVYGSDSERAAFLRTFEDGLLKTSPGDLLPFNDGSQDNAMGKSTRFFVAGDVRANEQTGLTAMHTVFMREHNRLAKSIKQNSPHLSDEEIYQRARKIVGAQIQAITFNEFLPALLGEGAIDRYRGYDPTVDGSVMNEFSTSLYRMGHSMIPSFLPRVNEQGEPIPQGHLELRNAFFNPARITREGGIDPVLRGLAGQQMEEVDTRVVDDLRSFLFGPPGAGGLDLAALNIQRGRDHGLPDYNTMRIAFGLEPARNFMDITSDPVIAGRLRSLYGSVHNVDSWVGALAEDHVEGASTGELLFAAIRQQFENLRDGDRFYYENDPAFTEQDLKVINSTSLADIIRRNTGVQNISNDVFHAGV
ncbi:MAG: peroxidase family protein [Planctomycetota bacterium]|nr:peroxidase family protein [Planctomycetota bacterium]